jgi:hypothetical protein
MRNSEIDFLQNAKSRLKVLNDTTKTFLENYENATSKEKQIAYNYIISQYGNDALKDFSVNIESLKDITKKLDELL